MKLSILTSFPSFSLPRILFTLNSLYCWDTFVYSTSFENYEKKGKNVGKKVYIQKITSGFAEKLKTKNNQSFFFFFFFFLLRCTFWGSFRRENSRQFLQLLQWRPRLPRPFPRLLQPSSKIPLGKVETALKFHWAD